MAEATRSQTQVYLLGTVGLLGTKEGGQDMRSYLELLLNLFHFQLFAAHADTLPLYSV